jgi:putative hydrolase of the HAD superfamily
MKKFIFDLDNTLYPASLQVFPLIDRRINLYMTSKLGIPEAEVDGLRRRYWKLYGVTLNGLMRHYRVDPEDYLTYVHDVDLSHLLKPNLRLRSSLEKIPGPKVIFTNGSSTHAQNVLNALGIEHLFEDIFDVRVAGFQPKPFSEPYLKVLELMNVSGLECVMIDDIPENLKTAKSVGMKTILVGSSNGHEYIDFCVEKACGVSEIIEMLQ